MDSPSFVFTKFEGKVSERSPLSPCDSHRVNHKVRGGGGCLTLTREGWMDGWMDGWMEQGRCRGRPYLFICAGPSSAGMKNLERKNERRNVVSRKELGSYLNMNEFGHVMKKERERGTSISHTVRCTPSPHLPMPHDTGAFGRDSIKWPYSEEDYMSQ
ncbi:hypothetical protein CPB86DRAFT_412862 [Serendipita vermifera]|nr:hypothetical protein CPB86DRAFT_412862 [Serendipita vermifera]